MQNVLVPIYWPVLFQELLMEDLTLKEPTAGFRAITIRVLNALV